MAARLLARAKINWALNITGRREDGYHLLDMLMQTIDLSDDIAFGAAPTVALWMNGVVQQGDGKAK